MLSNAEDEKFKEVMENVGMVKKPLHVRQFRNSLLEWMKDPGITLCIFYHVFRNNGFNVFLCVIQILDLRYRIYMLFSFFIIHYSTALFLIMVYNLQCTKLLDANINCKQPFYERLENKIWLWLSIKVNPASTWTVQILMHPKYILTMNVYRKHQQLSKAI